MPSLREFVHLLCVPRKEKVRRNGYLRYSAGGDLSESFAVINGSREPVGSLFTLIEHQAKRIGKRLSFLLGTRNGNRTHN